MIDDKELFIKQATKDLNDIIKEFKKTKLRNRKTLFKYKLDEYFKDNFIAFKTHNLVDRCGKIYLEVIEYFDGKKYTGKGNVRFFRQEKQKYSDLIDDIDNYKDLI